LSKSAFIERQKENAMGWIIAAAVYVVLMLIMARLVGRAEVHEEWGDD